MLHGRRHLGVPSVLTVTVVEVEDDGHAVKTVGAAENTLPVDAPPLTGLRVPRSDKEEKRVLLPTVPGYSNTGVGRIAQRGGNKTCLLDA